MGADGAKSGLRSLGADRSFSGSSLSDNQKKEMMKFESDRFNLDHEEAMVAYADGSVETFVGGKGSVNIVKDGKSNKDGTFTHNHPPSDDNNAHTVLSSADIDCMAGYKMNEVRMVTSDNGRKLVVRVRKNSNATQKDVEGFSTEIKKAQARLKRGWTKARKTVKTEKEFWSKVNDGVKIYEKVFSDTAPKYNLTFSKEYL